MKFQGLKFQITISSKHNPLRSVCAQAVAKLALSPLAAAHAILDTSAATAALSRSTGWAIKEGFPHPYVAAA